LARFSIRHQRDIADPQVLPVPFIVGKEQELVALDGPA
jgi:hypothetical protein